MENISKDKWKEQLTLDSNYIILDVRTSGECAVGIQQNAIQLNFMDNETFLEGVEKLDKSKSYYVYCRSGNRSSQVCMIMDQKGFHKTYNLIGGMTEWDGDIIQP